MDNLLQNLVDIATDGHAPNPVTGDQEPSDKLKLEATLKLAEMMGFHKGKNVGGVNITQLIYSQGK